ncbi:MAG TPA: RimK/LysX family protein [Bacteroidia bacterium]
MKKRKQKKISSIGRREWVDFPLLDLFGLEAKIDTGAFTSALHCKDIEIRNVDGTEKLCFKLLDESHPEYSNNEYMFSDYDKKVIKSSFGESEERYVIKTQVQIAGKKINCSISLTDRTNMRYPVLIGRRMIKGKFIVDVSKKYTGGPPTSKTFF